jgi:hypothetical protein
MDHPFGEPATVWSPNSMTDAWPIPQSSLVSDRVMPVVFAPQYFSKYERW